MPRSSPSSHMLLWGDSLGSEDLERRTEVGKQRAGDRQGASQRARRRRAQRLARGVEWFRLALLPEPRPEARRPPTRPSAREARS